MGRDRDQVDDPLDLPAVEPVLGEAFAGEPGDHLLGAGAGGHALRLDPGQGAGATRRGDRGAIEDVDLLGLLAGLRRLHRLRVAGRDRDLGSLAALPLAHLLGDVGGQHLGFERLAEDDLVDRLADDLLEAGHVDAGLLRVEVDEALEAGVEEVLGAVGLDPDHLLDAGDPDAGEADLGGGQRSLDVWGGWSGDRVAGHRLTNSKRLELSDVGEFFLPIIRRGRSVRVGRQELGRGSATEQ